MGDETYLEAFVETLGTLPHSVRRDLDLMKDLDRSHSRKLEELRQLQHEYIQHVEGKVLMNLEIVKDGTKLGLRSMNGQDIVVPTTQELFQYTHQDYPEMYSRIEQLQRDCLQLSDEKVSIAKQIHKTIDGTVQRLDKDIEAVETILQATGEFYVDAPAQTNELVACQVNPGDEWILAKVVGFDDTSMMYKLADEDVESNKSKTLFLFLRVLLFLSHPFLQCLRFRNSK